jgi:uncharacterized SAM-binding protein YcdF (DUF218 family)
MPGFAKADAIVVLGCKSRSRLRRRLDHAVELFRQGFAPALVLSGGGRGEEPEAEIMCRGALADGVPAAALLVERHSRDTLGNARETAALLRAHGRRTIILVSDRTHLPRAALLFRLAGVQIVGRSGVRSTSLAIEVASMLREAMALPRSLLRALVIKRESRRRRPACGRCLLPQPGSRAEPDD